MFAIFKYVDILLGSSVVYCSTVHCFHDVPLHFRNTGASLGSSSGRIGGILFPAINYLSKLDSAYARQLPLIVFGTLSVVGGFCALPLPETRQRPLPETIEDVENYEEFCRKLLEHEQEVIDRLEHANVDASAKVKGCDL